MQTPLLELVGLGALAAVVVFAVGKGAGWLQDRGRNDTDAAFEQEAQAESDLEERVAAVESRLKQLALRMASQELEVLDKAEKVARALQDRERKRRHRDEIPDEDHDEIPDHPDLALARARAAFPLPSLFPEDRS